MRTAEITGNMNSKRKILTCLYWTNRKAASTEGCEPFLIEKIITESKIYTPNGNKFIKLSGNILEEVVYSIDSHKEVEFKINFGKEVIKLSICKNVFSVSTVKEELEVEIIEKLKMEGKKMYPNICSKFPRRVGMHTYP